MSHVDDALRISEKAAGIVSSEIGAFESAHFSALTQYQHEDPGDVARHESASARFVTPVPACQPVSPARVFGMHRSTLADDAYLQARLVTGKSSTVSLEQYRRLGAVLHEAQLQNHTKTVMITSALPHEGKTLTVVNLALTLSESFERRVLMIDADLRSPSLHTLFDIPNDHGLTEALRGNLYTLPLTDVSDRLSVLTAGNPGATPLAGLSSPRMKEVLEECAARFDWVLLDTPPVGVLTDAQVLARLVGEVIMVIGAGSTPAAAVERTVAELGGADAITGTVLNRVDERRIPDAMYYRKYRAEPAPH